MKSCNVELKSCRPAFIDTGPQYDYFLISWTGIDLTAIQDFIEFERQSKLENGLIVCSQGFDQSIGIIWLFLFNIHIGENDIFCVNKYQTLSVPCPSSIIWIGIIWGI